jgi:hypothetical protein
LVKTAGAPTPVRHLSFRSRAARLTEKAQLERAVEAEQRGAQAAARGAARSIFSQRALDQVEAELTALETHRPNDCLVSGVARITLTRESLSFALTSDPATASGRAREMHMTEFLLVFHNEDRDFYEVRDTTNGEAHLNGTRLVDGATFEHRGGVWLATREDLEEGMARFVCTPR